nr:hypothetical protein [Segatella copri]
MNRLNPCCNGRWSRTGEVAEIAINDNGVLILVVMEDGLVHVVVNGGEKEARSLNPCCSGRWSRTYERF